MTELNVQRMNKYMRRLYYILGNEYKKIDIMKRTDSNKRFCLKGQHAILITMTVIIYFLPTSLLESPL